MWDATQVLLDAEITSTGLLLVGGKLTGGTGGTVLVEVSERLVLFGILGSV